MAQQPANDDNARRAFATHDYTTTTGQPTTLNERWVDVKTPGGLLAAEGDTYVVGTIDVNGVQPTGNTFSGAPVGWTSGSTSFTNFAQIGIVQRRDASQAIVAQSYFYGSSPGTGTLAGPTWLNMRAIAVWQGSSASDTRVVVCGETVDRDLPLAPSLSAATPNGPTGFLAVFNGSLQLLWTQRFFTHLLTERCAITDVAIYPEEQGGVTYDVVTYCGVSTHGNPGAGTSLTPLYPFDAPIGQTGSTFGSGSSSGGSSNWDGIVGRVRYNRTTAGITRDFHSIVGGSGTDALFGLTLLDHDTIAVVGNTTALQAVSVAFPFYSVPMPAGSGATWNSLATYNVGTLSIFDAAPTRTGQKLVLVDSEAIGRAITNNAAETLALDIWAAPFQYDGDISVYVAGVTTDYDVANVAANDLIDSLDGGACSRGAQQAHGGGQDGFLVHAVYDVSATLVTDKIDFAHATFRGGAGNEGLVGVAGWNGVSDRCAVAGFSPNNAMDLSAASVWNLCQQFVRADEPGSSNLDRPAALGALHAMAPTQLPYPTALGPVAGAPAGGGVAVDARFRVSIVGMSLAQGAATSFPVVGGLGARGGDDAVRVVYDMLPKGVWRTDGTGTRAAAFGAVPQPSTYYGGTTPVGISSNPCLQAYGQRPGDAAPALRRIWIDFQGPSPKPTDTPTITVSSPEPATGTSYTLALVQMSFPSDGTPITGLYLSRTELWVGLTPQVIAAGTGGLLTWTMPALPNGSAEFVVQGMFLLSAPLSCDPNASPGTVMSPGLVVSY